MSNKFDPSEELKKSIIALLFQLQDADGEVAPQEEAYIQHVGDHLGLSRSEVRTIGDHKDRYPLKPPSDEVSRVTILYYLLFFMRADAQISASEEKMIQEFAFRLGFRSALTSDLIQIMKKYSHSKVPPEIMLEKIKIYLN